MNIKWYYIALNCIDAIEMILSECDLGATNVKKLLEKMILQNLQILALNQYKEKN